MDSHDDEMRSLKIYIGNNDHQLAQLNVRSVDARKAFFRDVISRAFVDFRKNQRLIKIKINTPKILS